ncbi:MAG: CsgG/HfaB family protein [Treponema sp.]|jgi:curli biogenesis system outer membrane secretion channel CsgG|nr:CsgG/HfaB family protein [Treponema sp.]
MENKTFIDGVNKTFWRKNMKTNYVLGISFLLIFCFGGCSSLSRTRDQMKMIQPILDLEYERIIESIPGDSPIAVWWCFDERIEDDRIKEGEYKGAVTPISDWVQCSFQELLVGTGKFRVVTRIHLAKIFEEQRFQSTGHVDDATIASVGRILGAKFMIVPTITRYETLDVQIINSETGEITYISNRPIQKVRKG